MRGLIKSVLLIVSLQLATTAYSAVKVDIIKNPYGGSRNVPELSTNPDYIHAAGLERLIEEWGGEFIRPVQDIRLTEDQDKQYGPWNPMRLVQRHGRIDRLLSNHKRVFLRTFFPDKALDSLLNLEGRVRRKLALAAASVGVAQSPIQDGAQADLSFAETREEIEKIESEGTDIFEKGGTVSAAQTGEEYRQELRKALVANLKDTITDIPWKAGSGFVKGETAGHFFCAKVGAQTYLRFVPAAAETEEDVVEELGTCLRLIECEEDTDRYLPDSVREAAYRAWELAQENIWRNWDYFTDPKNLQPKVRKLNREVDAFLLDNPPTDVDRAKIDQVSETLMSPWPMREENKLRVVWKEEYPTYKAKALALIEAVEETGIEPFEQPERYPKIDLDEVRLICWLAIEEEQPEL